MLIDMKKYTKEQIEKAILHWFSQPFDNESTYDFEKMNAEDVFNASKEAAEFICNHIDSDNK
jgi:hypothetical protein